MKVSTIITAYNLEKYISEAIDSVLKQTRPADEIIVVDDCSSDNTANIIKSYGAKVQYLKMPVNSGGLSTTFYGLQHSSGDIATFLDGDDTWMPEKIEYVLALFEQYENMVIVSHDYQRVTAKLEPINYQDDTQENIERILTKTNDPVEQSELFKESILAKLGYWGGSAYSLRKKYIDLDAFENWRRSFQYIRNTYLDLVLPTFILVNHPDVMVGYVPKKLFNYRIHTNNTSGNNIPTIEAARKALSMGYRTTEATYGLIKDIPAYNAYARKQELFITEYEYLEDIYCNRKMAAWKKYLQLFKQLWNWPLRIKELKRIMIATIFGPTIFLKLKSRVSK